MNKKANCCTNLEEVKLWLSDLKKQGASKEDILDGLEFDSDEYQDMDVLKQAREEVFSE